MYMRVYGRMNPPGWPPGTGPSSAPPASGSVAVNEWGVPIQSSSTQQGGYATNSGFAPDPTPQGFATSPTSQPSFQPWTSAPQSMTSAPPAQYSDNSYSASSPAVVRDDICARLSEQTRVFCVPQDPRLFFRFVARLLLFYWHGNQFL